MTILRDLLDPVAVMPIVTAYYATINRTFPGNTPVVAYTAAQPATTKSGSTVTINVNQSWIVNALNPGNPAYPDIRDGLIYESFNVPVIVATSALQDSFKTSDLSLAAYGDRYSDLEATTVFHSSQVYTDLVAAGIALSQKGTNQLQSALGFAPNNTLQEYEADMRVTPHEVGANNHMQMLTPHLYEFEWVALNGGAIVAKKIKVWVESAIKASLGKPLDIATYNKYYEPVAKFIDGETSKPNFSSKASSDANMKTKVATYNSMIATVATKPKCGALSVAAYQCPTY